MRHLFHYEHQNHHQHHQQHHHDTIIPESESASEWSWPNGGPDDNFFILVHRQSLSGAPHTTEAVGEAVPTTFFDLEKILFWPGNFPLKKLPGKNKFCCFFAFTSLFAYFHFLNVISFSFYFSTFTFYMEAFFSAFIFPLLFFEC